ncbi:MAG TPA: EAL domain-containing protein [Micromonosporaceae bacterium]|nr:EAL domain-containing protein [Micromonosporaceae bacterium]
MPLGVRVEGERRAVIIGVNGAGRASGMPPLRYAGVDATTLAGLLTHRTTGTFDPGDVTVLVDEQATAPVVKRTLRALALRATASDMLFVYFAGHAVLPPWDRLGNPYLVTADFDLLAVQQEPEQGLRMRFLRDEVFEACAGSSFLVLDCCHAGGYFDERDEASRHRWRTLRHALGNYESQLSRHSTLLACARDARVRESDDHRHGVFTYEFLRALDNVAAGGDGVTFADAVEFVTGQPLDPEPLSTVQQWGPSAVLTRPHLARPAARPESQPAPQVRIVWCANPLDRSVSTIKQFLDQAFRPDEPTAAGRATAGPASAGPATAGPVAAGDSAAPGGYLERVRRSVSARGAAVVEFPGAGYQIRDATAGFGGADSSELMAQVASLARPHRREALGWVAAQEDAHRLLAVPLTHHGGARTSFLVVLDPAAPFLDLGEPLAGLLRALWGASSPEDLPLTEVEVLTALRESSGRLPLEIYEHCFAAYQRVLGSLVMVFEPVVELARHPRFVHVHAYEALARRDLHARQASGRALDLAYPWGDRFVIERDSVLAVKAIESYARAADSWQGPKLPGVSINVAVRALLSDAYVDALRNVIQETGLGYGAVTLEISERDKIEPRPGEDWGDDWIEYFRAHLTRLADDLRVGFAVDDFGVDHASLDRISRLGLTQIKVDRSVLAHARALDELRLVVQIARDALRRGTGPGVRDVVVEGMDEREAGKLEAIYAMGIQYVQGYIVDDRATGELRPLTPAVKKKIASYVRGADG